MEDPNLGNPPDVPVAGGDGGDPGAGGAAVPVLPQLPAVPAAQIIVDRENNKIPLFHADVTHDSFQAEYWIERLERLKQTNGWTDAQTCCNAMNALRGEALHLIQHIKMNYPDAEANWAQFKKRFIFAFGKEDKDTSNIQNLHVVQKQNESVQKFAHRVSVTMREFVASMDAPNDPDYDFIRNHPSQNVRVFGQWLDNENVMQLCSIISNRTASKFTSSISKTMFINGLHANLQLLVRHAAPQTFADAEQEAVKVDRHRRGPESHTVALEKNAVKVNLIKRGNGRGRGGSSRGRGSFNPTNGGSTNAGKQTNECWYCKAPGHTQKLCKKRINRGAPYVQRPRTVQEITMDDLGYQDAEIDAVDDQEQTDDQSEEQFEFFEEEDVEEVDCVNIASLHLN